MYRNKSSGKTAELIERNEKTRMVTLQFTDGKYTATTISNFEHFWTKLDDEKTVPVEEKMLREVRKDDVIRTRKKTRTRKENKKLNVLDIVEDYFILHGIKYSIPKNRNSVDALNSKGKKMLYICKRKNKIRVYFNSESMWLSNVPDMILENVQDNPQKGLTLNKSGYVAVENIETFLNCVFN